MDGQFGELGVSLEDYMQRILQLGALRVLIVILRVYIKKPIFRFKFRARIRPLRTKEQGSKLGYVQSQDTHLKRASPIKT